MRAFWPFTSFFWRFEKIMDAYEKLGVLGMIFMLIAFSMAFYIMSGQDEVSIYGTDFVRVDGEPVEVLECDDCSFYADRVIWWQDRWNNLEDKRTECAEDYLAEGLCKYLRGEGYICEVDS